MIKEYYDQIYDNILDHWEEIYKFLEIKKKKNKKQTYLNWLKKNGKYYLNTYNK